jgi:hypothetical protein
VFDPSIGHLRLIQVEPTQLSQLTQMAHSSVADG